MTLKPARLQWSEAGALFSPDYGDIYFQPGQGHEESDYVFLQGNRLAERFLSASSFRIAELGFGSGLNFLLTARLWQDHARSFAHLTYAAIEKHPIARDDLSRIFSHWPDLAPFADALLAQYPPFLEGFHVLRFLNGRIRLVLMLGDVADVLPQVSGVFDAWYLDGFSPAKNPKMWDEVLFPQIFARTVPGGTLATFSAAGAVRRGLADAGLTVEKTVGFGTKRDMTVAQKPATGTSTSYPAAVTVLGAGIAGVSAARALAERGCHVTVIDKHASFAMETSGNPAAVVYPKMTADPSPASMFYQHSFLFARSMVKSLASSVWQECGVLHLAPSAEKEQRHEKLSLQDWPADYLSFADTPWGRALLQPMAGYLSPVVLCQALLDHPNISCRFGAAIDQRPEEGPVVIALGMGSAGFADTAWLPLRPMRGQVTTLRANDASRAKITSVVCHDGYITPEKDGLHYIGATFQKEPLDMSTARAEDDLENLRKLDTHMPGLGFSASDIVASRAGYRATTPDKLPLVGRLPDYNAFVEGYAGLRLDANADGAGGYRENVYLATGFGAHGMIGAPLAGEIVTSLICGDPLPVPHDLMQHLIPERFILRALKRRGI